ncbi:MAG: hypothetical protein RQ824_04565 [bacterium]|nr:hypothetical protein [bacterium]
MIKKQYSHDSCFFALFFLFASLTALPGQTLAADETEVQFTFAQPPITKPMDKGESEHRFNLTYLKLDMDNAIEGRGINYMQKKGQERGGIAWNVGAFQLEDEDGIIDGFMINGGVDQEIHLGSGKNSIMFFGLTPSLMFMTFDISIPGIADIEVDVTTLNFNLHAGYEHQIPLGRVILTPYAKVDLNGSMSSSSTTTDIYSPCCYTDTTYDDNTDAYITQTIGFDILLPGGVSIASALNTGGDDDMTLIQVGWSF